MSTPSGFAAPDADAAVQRVRELSERLIELSKKNGLNWLEAYEKVLDSMLKLEEQVARGTNNEMITTLATTHADFVREVSQVFFGTFREQLKQ
jgi:hypothetical protein